MTRTVLAFEVDDSVVVDHPGHRHDKREGVVTRIERGGFRVTFADNNRLLAPDATIPADWLRKLVGAARPARAGVDA